MSRRLPALLAFSCIASAQTNPTARCVAAAAPAPRSEGRAGRLGEIWIACNGFAPNATVVTDLTVTLPQAVTNRISGANLTTETTVSNHGIPLPVAGIVAGPGITFPNLALVASPEGTLDLRLANLRVAARPSGAPFAPLQASLSLGLPPDRWQVTVAFPPGLDDDWPPPACVDPADPDCAPVAPKLAVAPNPAQLRFTATAGAAAVEAPGYIAVQNAGTGALVWKASVQYGGTASDWITLDPSGVTFTNNASVRAFVSAKGLGAGTYQANILIDATPDGSQTVPVTLTVSAAPMPAPTPTPTPQPRPVTVSRVLNAASRTAAPVVSGSMSVIAGSNFAGAQVAVTCDGLAARLLSATPTELLIVAPDLGVRTTTSLVVTVDGVSSTPLAVPVALAWPAIFPNGILNQDGTRNTPSNGAATGSTIQLFVTGIPAAGTGVTVQIHDRAHLAPSYAGGPGGQPFQQVNVAVPADLPAMTTTVEVCATVAGADYCSAGAPLTLR